MQHGNEGHLGSGMGKDSLLVSKCKSGYDQEETDERIPQDEISGTVYLILATFPLHVLAGT